MNNLLALCEYAIVKKLSNITVLRNIADYEYFIWKRIAFSSVCFF